MPGSEDRSRSPSDKSEPNNVSPYGLKYNDLAVVLELSEHGVSLSEPHDVAYYLYALSEQRTATRRSPPKRRSGSSTRRSIRVPMELANGPSCATVERLSRRSTSWW